MHGDDFVTSGEPKYLEWLRVGLSDKYSIKTHVLGDGPGQKPEVRVLNRILQWHPNEGVSYEADPRHVDRLIRETGSESLQAVSTPGTKLERQENRTRNYG